MEQLSEKEPSLNGSVRIINGQLVFCPAPGQENALKNLTASFPSLAESSSSTPDGLQIKLVSFSGSVEQDSASNFEDPQNHAAEHECHGSVQSAENSMAKDIKIGSNTAGGLESCASRPEDIRKKPRSSELFGSASENAASEFLASSPSSSNWHSNSVKNVTPPIKKMIVNITPIDTKERREKIEEAFSNHEAGVEVHEEEDMEALIQSAEYHGEERNANETMDTGSAGVKDMSSGDEGDTLSLADLTKSNWRKLSLKKKTATTRTKKVSKMKIRLPIGRSVAKTSNGYRKICGNAEQKCRKPKATHVKKLNHRGSKNTKSFKWTKNKTHTTSVLAKAKEDAAYCKQISEAEAIQLDNLSRKFKRPMLVKSFGGNQEEGTGLVERRIFFFCTWLEAYLKQMFLDEQADKELDLRLKEATNFGPIRLEEREINEDILNLLIERLTFQAIEKVEAQSKEAGIRMQYDAVWLYDNVRTCRVCGASFTKDNIFHHVKNHLTKMVKSDYTAYRQKAPCPRCGQLRYKPERCKCTRFPRQNEDLYKTVPRCPGSVWELIMRVCPDLPHSTRNEALHDYDVMNKIIGVDLNRTHKEGRFSCPLCHMTFALRMNAKIHMRRHAGTLHIPCEDCGKYTEDVSHKIRLHKQQCTGRPDLAKIVQVTIDESTASVDAGEFNDGRESPENVDEKISGGSSWMHGPGQRHSLINRLLHGKPLSAVMTIGEYCPEKAWTIVDMQRSTEWTQRQMDRQRQLKILELMNDQRLEKMWQSPGTLTESTKKYTGYSGKSMNCRICQMSIKGFEKQVVHIMAHCGIWVYFCTVCRGRPKFLSKVRLKTHGQNVKHGTKVSTSEESNAPAGGQASEKAIGTTADGSDNKDISPEIQGASAKIHSGADTPRRQDESSAAVAELEKQEHVQDSQPPAQFINYHQNQFPTQQHCGWPLQQLYGPVPNYGQSYLPDYGGLTTSTVQGVHYAQLETNSGSLLRTDAGLAPGQFAPAVVAMSIESHYQPNLDLPRNENINCKDFGSVPGSESDKQPNESEAQAAINVSSKGKEQFKKKKEPRRRKPYRKRGELDPRRERVYADDSCLVKRILLCPEKVLEILQVLACGGEPDWSDMPKCFWATRQKRIKEQKESEVKVEEKSKRTRRVTQCTVEKKPKKRKGEKYAPNRTK